MDTCQSISDTRLLQVQNLPKLPQPEENTFEDIDREQPKIQKRVYTVLKWLVSCFLFSGMLTGLILNQLTLAKTISLLTMLKGKDDDKIHGFVMLMFITLIPNLFNAARCYLVGTFAKDAKTFPWPNKTSLTIGVVASVLEIVCITEILFISAPYLHPDIFLLLLAGTFSATILLQMCNIFAQEEPEKLWKKYAKSCLLLLSFLMHTVGLIGIPIVMISTLELHQLESEGDQYMQLSSYAMMIASLFMLSVLWSPNIQNLTIQPHLKMTTLKNAFLLKFVGTENEVDKGVLANARWKGGMLYSCIKFLTFLVLAPVAFFAHNYELTERIFSEEPTNVYPFNLGLGLFIVLGVNIILAVLVYAMGYIACSICSQRVGFLFPLTCSTPLTVILMQFWKTDWPGIEHTLLTNHDRTSVYISVIIIFLGIALLSTQLSYTYIFLKNSKIVMATDDLLFLLPTYNPIFLGEYFLLNRRVDNMMLQKLDGPFARDKSYDNATIFICSTMYHESEIEMRNLLLSIKSVADAAADGFLKQKFESHIFFDGANQGRDLNMYAMRLISLLEECFGVGLEDGMKRYTPYGIQLAWIVSDQLRFVIHCKNGKKVKNKKRWSQVMYMYYTLFFRVPTDNEHQTKEELDEHYERTFILTTDADIVFTPESVKSLIEMLVRDRTVGAVCARTHPLGTGPVVWYQVFDYAVGHWFQKVAENIMGSVLCCPGCFSLFRTSALKDVVQIYASNVSLAKDFLTKDMGEDRWLCTLLVQHGWRLEYCAVAENFTFCPDHFEEFYKQRRRWIPSTLANLFELVSSGSQIVKRNNFISYLFVFYQILNIVSTILSPGAVIIVLVGGITVAFGINQYITLAVQLGIAGAFMLVCLYTSQKTQLTTAKILTGVYALMMTAVVVGLVGQGASSIGDTLNNYYLNKSVTSFEDKILKGSLTSFTTFYLIFLSFVYTIAALLHPFEAYQVLNFVWYIVCLPSGYLLLIIYSFCNLTDRSWGTREATAKSDSKPFSYYINFFRDQAMFFCSKCFTKPEKEEKKLVDEVKKKPEIEIEVVTPVPIKEEVKEKRAASIENPCPVSIMPGKDHMSVESFLGKIGMSQYEENFCENGYENVALIAKLKNADLNDIGIVKRGHVLKIMKAIKEIYVFEADIPAHIPTGIYDWLQMLCLPEKYGDVFAQEGYTFKCDMENLIGMEEKELLNMGITKRGHLQRFREGLKKLEYPTVDELRLRDGHEYLRRLKTMNQEEFEKEDMFWLQLRSEILKVDNSMFQAKQEAKLKINLEELRNNFLLLLIVANSIWLLAFFLLDSAQFHGLRILGKVNLIGMIFVLIYGSIYFIQFVCLLLHRVYTLMHFVADASYFPGSRAKRRSERAGTGLTRTNSAVSVLNDDQIRRHSGASIKTPLLEDNRNSRVFNTISSQSMVLDTSFISGKHHKVVLESCSTNLS